ncbi:hypothetical protein ES332_D07G139700v1 [Gossypium tomentosum]|uniref:Uncharacterized protein n=1 Tax=Gossypium tomentosum TaxID=34277 RepID=A0A5D2K755_GOSTO|nr:hypothetical protein ES332_D07G139700v1 [Gossypium tomentosum]
MLPLAIFFNPSCSSLISHLSLKVSSFLSNFTIIVLPHFAKPLPLFFQPLCWLFLPVKPTLFTSLNPSLSHSYQPQIVHYRPHSLVQIGVGADLNVLDQQ